jgi:hypothetical protein
VIKGSNPATGTRREKIVKKALRCEGLCPSSIVVKHSAQDLKIRAQILQQALTDKVVNNFRVKRAGLQ